MGAAIKCLAVATAMAAALGSAEEVKNHYILCEVDVKCAAIPVFAYIGSSSSNYVTVIDTDANVVVALVDVGQTTTGVAVNPAGTRAYFANGESLVVLDTSTNAMVATVAYGVGSDLVASVAVTSDGTRVYVTDPQNQGIAVIDTATNRVISAELGGAHNVFALAPTPDGTHLYVTNSYDDTITVVDTVARTVVATIPVNNPYTSPPSAAGDWSALPLGVVLNRAGTRAYVANAWLSNQAGGDVYMSVVDTATNAIIANVPTGPAESIAITSDPDGTRVYLSNGAVIDTASNSIVATLPLDTHGENSVRGLALTPSGTRLYAAVTTPPSVIVIDVNTRSVVATIPIWWGTPFAMGQFIAPPIPRAVDTDVQP